MGRRHLPQVQLRARLRAPTENVTIANCFVTGIYQIGSIIDGTWKKFPDDAQVPRQGRIKCGTESNGGFRNITISNCVIEGSKGIALETSDGAFLEDIAITGNTLRDTIDAPLFLRLNRRNRNPKETLRPGTLRRILISNLVSYNSAASTAALFSGIPSNLIEDVKLSNCYFGHEGLPTKMRIQWGAETRPMPDWHNLQVPEIEAAYPELLQFGPTPSKRLLHPPPEEPRDVPRRDRSSATPTRAPPSGSKMSTAPTSLPSPPRSKPNFSLHNVTDFHVVWSRAAKDVDRATASNEVI